MRIIRKIKNIFKNKEKPVYPRGIFGVKEISYEGRRLNLAGDLVSVIKIFNERKPYLPMYTGKGWEFYLRMKNIPLFDATGEQQDEMKNVRGFENLSQLEIEI